jgi:hypothetical protein
MPPGTMGPITGRVELSPPPCTAPSKNFWPSRTSFKNFLKEDLCHANLGPGGGEDDRHVAAGLPASATAPTLGFAIAARRSELVALEMANIDEARPTVAAAGNPYHLRREPVTRRQRSPAARERSTAVHL